MDYHITLKGGTILNLSGLDNAGISYIPCTHEKPLFKFNHLWDRSRVGLSTFRKSANAWSLSKMQGVQIFTGKPTRKMIDGVDHYLLDIDIEQKLVGSYPDHLQRILDLYKQSVSGVPCIVKTKSGGFRLSAFVAMLGNKVMYSDDSGCVLEFFSYKGLSRLDDRYSMVSGSILDVPSLQKSTIYEIREIVLEIGREQTHKPVSDAKVVERINLKDLELRFDSDGRSQYLPASQCEVTEHQNYDRFTVQYYQVRGGVLGRCFNCGGNWWACEPTEKIARKPVRLHKQNYAVERILDTVMKASEQIAKFLRSASRVFALKAETGAGKNYQTESYAVDVGAVLQSVPHTDLAVELEDRLLDRLGEKGWGRDSVFRWKGIYTGYNDKNEMVGDFPYDVLCIQAERADAYRAKGGNMYRAICPTCPVESECFDSGYLSQVRKATASRACVMPVSDAFTNPNFHGFIKRILKDDAGDRLCIVDDVNIFSLFSECELSKERLRGWYQMWRGCRLGIFAQDLLHILEVEETPFAIGAYIDVLNEQEFDEIREQMQRVRVPEHYGLSTTYRVMSLDDAVLDNLLDNSENKVSKLPSVDGAFTTLDKLKVFFDRYKRESDAPISYRDGSLGWVIPPVLHSKVKKIGFMSATLDLDLFKRIFPDAELFDVPVSRWVDGTEVYQIRTGRYPRRSVLELDSEFKFKGLNRTGLKLWRDMITEIQNSPHQKHAVITYKSVLEWAAVDIKELGIITANYGGLVGLDTEFKDVDVLWVVFSPEISELDVARRAKIVFGDDATPLNFERADDGAFRDKRVQQVYDCGVISELVQAVGRARINRRACKVVIVSSHRIPHITDRPETILYDEVDWHNAGGLANLKSIVLEREKNEREIVRRLDAGESQRGLAKEFKYSDRQVRNLAEKARHLH